MECVEICEGVVWGVWRCEGIVGCLEVEGIMWHICGGVRVLCGMCGGGVSCRSDNRF